MANGRDQGIDRRTLLAGLGLAGGAVALAGGRVEGSSAEERTPNPDAPFVPKDAIQRPVGAAVRAFLGELAEGAALPGGYAVARVFDLHQGTIPVVVAAPDGHRFQVDVLRRDDAAGAARGPASTASCAASKVNRARGATAAAALEGLGALALAQALAARESDGAPVPELLTLRERSLRHPVGLFGVPTGPDAGLV